MGSKLNWERCTKENRARRNGSDFAYADLPATGSIADRVRRVPNDAVPMRRDRLDMAVVTDHVPVRRVSPFDRMHLLTGLIGNSRWAARSPTDRQSMLNHLAAAVTDAQRHEPTLNANKQSRLDRAIEVLKRWEHTGAE